MGSSVQWTECWLCLWQMGGYFSVGSNRYLKTGCCNVQQKALQQISPLSVPCEAVECLVTYLVAWYSRVAALVKQWFGPMLQYGTVVI